MLSLSEMAVLCREVNAAFSGSKFSAIREAGLKKWVLIFEKQQKKIRLLVCALSPFSRFHLSTLPISGKETGFTKKVEDRLEGASFAEAFLLNEDRILSIALQKEGKKFFLIFELCFKHPKVVVTAPSFEILDSLEPNAEAIYLLPKSAAKQPLAPVEVDSPLIEARYAVLETKADFEKKASAVRHQLQQRLKKALSRADLHRAEIEEAKQWQEITHIGELLKSHYHLLKKGMSSVVVEDWLMGGEVREIPLDPLLSPQETIKRHFKQLRKLQKRGEVAGILLMKAENERAVVQGFLDRLAAIVLIEDLDALALEARCIAQEPKQRAKREEKKHPYAEFVTEAGLHIFVGRKDKDNDRLSFSFARGNDHWFHAANVAGSHVVLKVPKSGTVDDESVQDALQLALHFSKARGRAEDEVTMTECKFLSKSKGSKPGQVNVSKHKTVRVRLDSKRLQRLLGRIG